MIMVFDEASSIPEPAPKKRVQMQMVARAKRRNAARRGHELHAWKLRDNGVRLSAGQRYVLYPLVSTRA